MTKFRPCIDLHNGQVKQLVGSSLSGNDNDLKTNFVSTNSAGYYADIYRKDGLSGGHVIKLGPGNDVAARAALSAFPSGLQIGGGINLSNAAEWLQWGASHIIVTSWLFNAQGNFLSERLGQLVGEIGKERVVLDLSCRAQEGRWIVTMNRWQSATDLEIDASTLRELSESCDEFLIHAADMEGKCEGIDTDLVELLGSNCPIPVTYAGGANALEDLGRVEKLSGGKVDLTIGSALDLFGGKTVDYADCLAWNSRV